MKRGAVLGLLLGSVSMALAAVEVRFTPLPDVSKARIVVKIDRPATEFRMPAWLPGDYQIFDYGKRVESLEFYRKGQPVPVAPRTEDPNLWVASTEADEVRYVVNPSRGNFSPNLQLRPKQVFFGGGVFGGFTPTLGERHTIVLDLPSAESTVASAMVTKRADQPLTAKLEARNYDELLDSPTVFGEGIRTKEFRLFGKPHWVATFGTNANANLDVLERSATAVVRESHAIFGTLPYRHYVFLFDFGGGGGGLEHAECTRIGLGGNSTGEGADGIIFHEYFHTFNVKRIRSKPLGPFDYTKPAITGALWWLEGVTDYYADILMIRAVISGRDESLGDYARQVLAHDRNPARLRVSVDEASRRVWEARGSYGFGGINYYGKGRLVGFLLDMALRGATDGKRSLDDVMRRLWEECRDGKPGFSETRIRELCVEIGGATLGDIYDRAVLQPVNLPATDAVQKVGLELGPTGWIERPAASQTQRAVTKNWPMPVKPTDR